MLAIVLAFFILIGYQYLFVDPQTEEQQAVTEQVEQTTPEPPAKEAEMPAAAPVPAPVPAPAPEASTAQEEPQGYEVPSLPARQGKEITVETSLYSAVISESGGGLKSFQLKNYRETTEPDSELKELVKTEAIRNLPLYFSWGVEPSRAQVPLYTVDKEAIDAVSGQDQILTMKATMSSGLEFTRTLVFEPENYLIKMSVEINNPTEIALQGAPYLSLANRPFSEQGQRYFFTGPVAFIDGKLQEVKTGDLEKGPKTLKGNITWAAYEGTYFMTGIIPEQKENLAAKFSADGDKVVSVLTGPEDVIQSQGHLQYNYLIYFGPKKISTLQEIGHDLDRAINFGWFDKLARPALYLLNFFYGYVGNYGVAIILVTILIKMLFWPIAQKGLKSMKNMQKIQPKMAKLKEKYKNDKTRLNEEMMGLYKTYKVNPLGGCLPMLLQIPVFFALYKVLLQAIELRHAPFMLWITDLSAPDRLMIGLDIPYLGGLPILTLLMGGSMFLQQKMTPSPADPTQAKIMMFLPVIFTFMFLNFASGLVLYWLVNNLLTIGQQYMINRQTAS
ncbi:MAG: membrane protein insertase YidC [Proteobacteria bacterium]|nr:membrane protein insertase YidC [Pseudomonadota bacterium]